MASAFSPHGSRTKQQRPERQGRANRLHPNLNTLIKHGVLFPGDKLTYGPYTVTINNTTKPSTNMRITLDLQDCPWLQSKLKNLGRYPNCPPIGYVPTKEAPTHLAMSPSTFKRVADWAIGGYSDEFQWKNCRGAFASKHFLVRTMGGKAVSDDVSLGFLRSFFARDVEWDYAMRRPRRKPKTTCRKKFVDVGPESDFSRLVHFLMNGARESDDDDDGDDFPTGICSNGNSAVGGVSCVGSSGKSATGSSGDSGASEDDEEADDSDGDPVDDNDDDSVTTRDSAGKKVQDDGIWRKLAPS